MSDDDTPRFDRRSVLKAFGTTGAVASLSGAVQALGGAEKANEIDAATRTDSFRAFDAKFGGISIDRGASSVTRMDDAKGQSIRVELQTGLGEMGVIMIRGKDADFDLTLLDLSTADDAALPAQYAGAPEGTRPLLFTSSEDQGLQFRRDATDAEKAALSDRTGIPAEDIEANLQTEAGGFVVAGGTDLADDAYLVVELDDVLMREVPAQYVAEAHVFEDEVSANLDWWCTYRCGSCLTKAAGCVGCCLAVYIGCIACIIWNCGLGASACYDCYGCLS